MLALANIIIASLLQKGHVVFFHRVQPTRSIKKKCDRSLVFRGIHGVNDNVLGVPWPHHEGGLVSTHVWGGAVLGHVGFLRCLDILLLLLDPVGGNLKHQTLRDGDHKTAMSDELDEQNEREVWFSPSDDAGGSTSSSFP